MYIWGGTSALPIAEAVMVDGENVDSGKTLSFADNYTINEGLNDGAGVRLQSDENITINAEGNLNILGSGFFGIHSRWGPCRRDIG